MGILFSSLTNRETVANNSMVMGVETISNKSWSNLLIAIIFTLPTITVFAQKQEKLFYDADWKGCIQSQAQYYRLVTFNSQGKPVGKVYDYYITGELQGEADGALKIDKYDDENSIFIGLVKSFYKSGVKKWEELHDKQGNIVNYKSWDEKGKLKDSKNYSQQSNVKNGKKFEWYAVKINSPTETSYSNGSYPITISKEGIYYVINVLGTEELNYYVRGNFGYSREEFPLKKIKLSNEKSQTTLSGRTKYFYTGTYELSSGAANCRVMTYRPLSSFIEKGVIDDTEMGSNKEVFLLANRITIIVNPVILEITPLSQESLPFMLESER